MTSALHGTPLVWTVLTSPNARWLHLDIGAATLVPIAASEFGFEYHHVTLII